MTTKYFGTDGIRGEAGVKLNAQFALKFGYVFAKYLKDRFPQTNSVVIGRDSRLSSDMLFSATAAGLLESGFNVLNIGMVTTPMLAFYCKTQALPGIMITASHNPIQDNGLKVFGTDGYKLSRIEEEKVDLLLQSDEIIFNNPNLPQMGTIYFNNDAAQLYYDFVVTQIPVSNDSKKLNIVVDCAFGATCGHAEKVLEHYANLMVINNQPNGNLINVNCGATCLDPVKQLMKSGEFDLGVSFDGDGDRVLFTNRLGEEINGDKIIAFLALYDSVYHNQKMAVMTQMTNMGTETYLAEKGIKLLRTEVGDINVLEAMIQNNVELGGEQSGHIILKNHCTTGDGILVAAKVLNLLTSHSQSFNQLLSEIVDFPSKKTNLKLRDKNLWINDNEFQASLQDLTNNYSNKVRIYIRPSGTEPVLRILTESSDALLNEKAHSELCELFLKYYG